VWPEALHQDFVTAIFDVGLKCSTLGKIQEFTNATNAEMPEDMIHALLAKFRYFRQAARERGEDKAQANDVAEDGSVRADLEKEKKAAEAAKRNRDQAKKEEAIRRRKQAAILRDSMTSHMEFVSEIEAALRRELKLQKEMASKMLAAGVSVDPMILRKCEIQDSIPDENLSKAHEVMNRALPQATGMSRNPSNQSLDVELLVKAEGLMDGPRAGGGGNGGSGMHSALENSGSQVFAGITPVPLSEITASMPLGDAKQLQSDSLTAEMESHMSMHRQMLTRRDAQISQYEAKDGLLGLPSTGLGDEHGDASRKPRSNTLDEADLDVLSTHVDAWDYQGGSLSNVDSSFLFHFLNED